MDKSQKIITEGDFESYDKVEGLVREALQVGEIEKGNKQIFFTGLGYSIGRRL